MNAERRVLIAMLLSDVADKRSFGGVDTVCQTQLAGLLNSPAPNTHYFIVAFNPANDCVTPATPIPFAPFVTLHWHNMNTASTCPNWLYQELTLRKHVAAIRPHVVHAHLPYWFLFKQFGERKVLTLHSYRTIGRHRRNVLNNFFHERLLPFLGLRSTDVLTTVSKDIAALIEGERGTPVRYLPNPIAPEFMAAPPARRLSSSAVSLLLVGSVIPSKRVHDALDLLAVLQKDFPCIHLRVAGSFSGDSPYYKFLVEKCQRLGITDNVTFLGRLTIAQLKSEIHTAHIGLSLSECETFGLAPLEMLAQHLPVVATAVAVMKWHQADLERLGVSIVEVGDIGAMARAITKLIASDGYTASLDLTSYLAENFGLKAYTSATNALYQKASGCSC